MTSHPTQQPQHQPETVDAETGLSPEQTAAAEGRHTGTRQDDGYRQDEELRKDDGLRDDDLRRGGDDDLRRGGDDDLRRGGDADMRSTDDVDTSYRTGSPSDQVAAAGTAGSGAAATRASTGREGNALLGDDHDLSSRWDQVQSTFVDDPRRAVSDAAGLVEDTLRRLSDTFAQERARGEGAGNDEAGTEDLRLAMQRYREFFRRLLAA